MGQVFEQLSGAQGIRNQGTTANNIAKFNAKVSEQGGKSAQLRAGFGQIQQAKAAERAKSSLRAGLGSAGGLSSDVATDILGTQAGESELENLLIGFEGETANQRAKSQATGQRLQGKAAKAQAKSAARKANVDFGIQLAMMVVGASTGGGFGGAASGAKGAGSSFLSGFNTAGRGAASGLSGGGTLNAGPTSLFDLNAGMARFGGLA
jgi:hypothetical protein